MFIIWLPVWESRKKCRASDLTVIWQMSENESFNWLMETIAHYKGFPLKIESKCKWAMLKKFIRSKLRVRALLCLWDDPDQDQWSEITRIMVDQMNRWIHSGQGFIGSFDLQLSKWSQIADPDPVHPKGCTQRTLYVILFPNVTLESFENWTLCLTWSLFHLSFVGLWKKKLQMTKKLVKMRRCRHVSLVSSQAKYLKSLTVDFLLLVCVLQEIFQVTHWNPLLQ